MPSLLAITSGQDFVKMLTITLPAVVEKSCLNVENYPENLILEITCAYPSMLKSYKARLDNLDDDFFVDDEQQIEVSYREFKGSGDGKRTISHIAHLKY